MSNLLKTWLNSTDCPQLVTVYIMKLLLSPSIHLLPLKKTNKTLCGPYVFSLTSRESKKTSPELILLICNLQANRGKKVDVMVSQRLRLSLITMLSRKGRMLGEASVILRGTLMKMFAFRLFVSASLLISDGFLHIQHLFVCKE